MSKEQIEEMAKLICTDFGKKCDSCTFAEHFCCPATAHAEIFYNAGYRKRRVVTWVSVDERLPEENIRVLVYLNETLYDYTHIDTDRIKRGSWVRWGKAVTHWMPLPEPPKMKGGAE